MGNNDNVQLKYFRAIRNSSADIYDNDISKSCFIEPRITFLSSTEQSHEKQFLKDFVFVIPDSAGGRLAAWIQPESRLDPNRCELKIFQDPVQSGWPTKLAIETRDQYGEIVYVPNIKIQLKVTLSSNFSNEKRYSKVCKDQNVFIPSGKVTYDPVIKEKEKICIKSITAMKAYSQYSFEELRLFTPTQNKSSNLLTAKDTGDQSYSVLWTPETSGSYIINIIIDGSQVNENYNIKVINANVPPPIKEQALKKIQPQYKYRKFYAEYSSGLRIRLHPTLQADQIGVIKVNDIISFVEEQDNGDGVWVKLSSDSIRKFCSSSWYPTQAWCLAYNKHFNKRLLFTLIESNCEATAVHPIDDMNNFKFFDDSEYYSLEGSSNIQISSNYEDEKLEENDEIPQSFDASVESQVEKTNQSNITAAIAGVVEGGAHKLQAFQKWLKRDSLGDTTATIRKKIGSIPEAYNNNTLDLKNLNTNNFADKLSNDISLTSPIQENIIPTSRITEVEKEDIIDQNDANLLQRDQFADNNEKQSDYETMNTPKQALSSSISETIRAIFAAFLWHEGLVHDAIACASFLKFHPSMPKNNVYELDETMVLQQHEVLTKEEKIQQRHSVEIASTSKYLSARPSTLETLNKSGYCCVHYRKFRGKAYENMFRSNDDIFLTCPPALKCLVFVWDELNTDFQSFAAKIMADRDNKETPLPKMSKIDDPIIDNSMNKNKTKKFIDECTSPQGAIGGSSDNTIWCDLCENDISPGNNQSSYEQNAFTQHLKVVHPGCGESAKGKGYNSNGVYCEGWAGQCGEEGIGATSWYLLCELCREKYLTQCRKVLNVNEAISKKTVAQDSKQASSHPSTFNKKSKLNFNLSTDFFETMKDNALFLLDLNSHNGGLLNKTSDNNLTALKRKGFVRNNSGSDYVLQPNTSHLSKRLSATIFDEHLRKPALSKQNSTNYSGKEYSSDSSAPELLWTPPESITCLEMLNAKITDTEAGNILGLDNEKNLLGQQQPNQGQDSVSTNENKFHRSFSMIQGWGLYSLNPNDRESSSQERVSASNQVYGNNENKVVMRRKKVCVCDSSKLKKIYLVLKH